MRIPHTRWTLTTKTLVLLFAILLGMGTVTSVVTLSHFATTYRGALQEKAVVLGEGLRATITHAVGLGLGLDQLEGVNDQLRAAREKHADLGYVVVVDKTGKVLYSSESGSAHVVSTGTVEKRAAETAEILIQPATVGGTRYYDVALPLLDVNKHPMGAVRLGLRASVINGKVWAVLGVSLVVSLLSLVVGGVVMAVALSRSVTQPVTELAHAAASIAQGDLSPVVTSHSSKDEVGLLATSFTQMVGYLQGVAEVAERVAEGDLRETVSARSDKDVLGRAFDRMIAGLRRIVVQVRGEADQIATASTEVRASSEHSSKGSEESAMAIEEVSATLQEMSATIQNVARNTQVQTASVGQTSTAVRQMVTSIQRVAEGARQLADRAEKSSSAVATGLTAVTEASLGMQQITQALAESAGTITSLGSGAKSIGRIVEVIDDIAEQTNLLALNAAIEAARAGEHGLGFSVVAEEVRRLAERCARSTQEIAALVSRIQEDVERAITRVEEGSSLVERGRGMSGQVEQALQEIEGVVGDLVRHAVEIGTATTELSTGSEEIEKSAVHLTEIIQEISAATEQQSAGTNQVATAMERMREMVQQNAASGAELAASAEQLAHQSDTLQEIVSRFLVEQAGDPAPAPAETAVPASAARDVARRTSPASPAGRHNGKGTSPVRYPSSAWQLTPEDPLVGTSG